MWKTIAKIVLWLCPNGYAKKSSISCKSTGSSFSAVVVAVAVCTSDLKNKIVTNRTSPYISSASVFNLIFDTSYKYNENEEDEEKKNESRTLNKFYKFGMKQSAGENLEFMENR